jgi:hypothetical protein
LRNAAAQFATNAAPLRGMDEFPKPQVHRMLARYIWDASLDGTTDQAIVALPRCKKCHINLENVRVAQKGQWPAANPLSSF